MACSHQSLKTFQYIRRIGFHLIQEGARNRKCHLEPTLVALNKLQQQRVHREVAFLRYLLDHIPVEVVIPIIVIFPNVKKSIGLQSVGLVDLKIKADSSHAR
jgi:hypothetical protein